MRAARPSAGGSTRPLRSRRTGTAAAAILGGTALIGWHGALFGNWIVDDAGITFAYVRSITEGHGVVLQPGAEPTEGFSNVAWLLLLALGRLVGLFDHGTVFGIPDYALFPKLLALACCAGILVACYLAATKVTRWPAVATFVTGGLLAVNPSFVAWCFSGLENSLYALAVVGLAVVLFRAAVDDRLLRPGTVVLAGAFAALAALTRPDGLIYVAAYPLVLLVFVRRATLIASVRSAALSSLAFLVPVGAYFLWRYLTFGTLLSLPAMAKNQGLPEFTDLSRSGDLLLYVGALAAIAFAVVVGLVLRRPSPLRTGLVPLLVTLSLAVVAYSVLKPDWMGEYRFATPVWAVGSLVAALAGGAAVRQAGVRGRNLLVVLLALVLALSGSQFATASQEFRAGPVVPMCTVAERYGRAFNAYADILGVENGSLLLPDVGGTALTSRLSVVDLAGLTHRRMAELWSEKRWAAIPDYLFGEVEPTFIHAHGSWGKVTRIVRDDRLAQDYHRIRSAPNAGGDWVRKDAVPGPAKLAELRAYASDQVDRIKAETSAAPRAACGPVLRRGQLPVTTS